MYNARDAAAGQTVSEIQSYYKNVFPRIQKFREAYEIADQKNTLPLTLGRKISNTLVAIGFFAACATLVYLFIYSIQNIKEPFNLSMAMLGILVGGPITILTLVITYIATTPSSKKLLVKYPKFPLKNEEKVFMALIKKLGVELGSGDNLQIFVDQQRSDVSFKQQLPKHILFRGSNDDPSKRSFLFEVEDDEITILLPDYHGIYKYASKKHVQDNPFVPNANFPQYIGDSAAMISDTF